MQPAEEITHLLHRWGEGDAPAFSQLIPLGYERMRQFAYNRLRCEPDGSLRRTAAMRDAGVKPDDLHDVGGWLKPISMPSPTSVLRAQRRQADVPGPQPAPPSRRKGKHPMTRLRLLLRAFPLIIVSSACSDGDPSGLAAARCASRSTPTHACVVWTPAGGAYHLTTSVHMDSLRIEAGTVIYAAPGVMLRVGHLTIYGAAEQPVQLLATDTTAGWGGITGLDVHGTPEGTADIRHARIEHALGGVHLRRATITDTYIRRTNGTGIDLWDGGTLTRVSIEQAGGQGMVLGSASRVEDATIRHSGGGIGVAGIRSTLTIAGGSIEDNAGHGIVASRGGDPRRPGVRFERPVRITRNGGYPLFDVPLQSLAGVMSEPEAWEGMRGNGRDTIVAHGGHGWGGIADGPLRLREGLPVRLAVACQEFGVFPLTMLPGSRLELEVLWGWPCPSPPGGGMFPRVLGTAEQPATIVAQSLFPMHAAEQIRHARIRNVVLYAQAAPVEIEHVHFENSVVLLHASGSRISDSRMTMGGLTPTSAGQPLLPAVGLAAGTRMERTIITDSHTDGVHISGPAQVVDCAVRRSARYGILAQEAVLITGCDIEENGDVGIHNESPVWVAAQENWWGDPAGPFGPSGDGVSGLVLYEPFRTSPVGVLPGHAADLHQPITSKSPASTRSSPPVRQPRSRSRTSGDGSSR
jgi:hypothetical protein